MSPNERKRISALLVALDDEADPQQQHWLKGRLNDRDPDRWIPAEDVLRELDQLD
ncbi:MAG: hypothetical protein AAGH89_01990 [Verrucomicrobiota bacterium]